MAPPTFGSGNRREAAENIYVGLPGPLLSDKRPSLPHTQYLFTVVVVKSFIVPNFLRNPIYFNVNFKSPFKDRRQELKGLV